MPGRMRRLAATLPRLTQGRPSTQQRFEHARCKVSSALLERLQRQPTGGAYKVFQTPLGHRGLSLSSPGQRRALGAHRAPRSPHDQLAARPALALSLIHI